jgi:tetratricopeptide (TPR) repeat protein
MLMRRSVLCLLLALVLAIGWALEARRVVPTVPLAPTVSRLPYDPTQLDKTIRFYVMRAQDDPKGAIDWAMLAGAYLQRCRETGDIADALRGEQAARRSLAIRAAYNYTAYDALALSLLTQHRFREAGKAAQQALAQAPDDPQAQALILEITIESGDYAQAEQRLRADPQTAGDANGLALRARLAEMEGRPEAALVMLRKAQAQADQNANLPRENVAWFHMRVGDLLAAMGHAQEAGQAYQEALALYPRDYKTLKALARLAAGRGDWTSALAWSRQSAAIVPMPDTIALVGDAFATLGQKQEAESQYQLIEAIGKLSRAQGVVYDRQRALYCADHDRDLDEALVLARRELQSRHDVYAFDTLAWVCFKKGLLTEADATMRKALVQGTQDAALFYHAGRIALARGDRAQAKVYLQRALAINPYFLPFAPELSRQILAQIG